MGDNYEPLADGIHRVSGNLEVDPYHNTYPIVEDACDFFSPSCGECDQYPPPRD